MHALLTPMRRISGRIPGRVSGRIGVAAALAATVLAVAAPPASAAEKRPVTYAALGDSYSSGVGTPDPDPAVPACDRTPFAWPYQVGVALGWQTVNIACSGATTQDIVAPFGGQPAQTALLAALRPRPRVVSITVGGNDIGFGPVLAQCFVGNCTAAVAASEVAMVTLLPGRLARTYRAVEAADPRARLVVVGYPRLFPRSASAVTGCPWLSGRERRSLNHAAAVLDGVIAVEAFLAGATYVDIRDSLAGHELCTADSWLVPLPAPGAAHPTVQGQQAIAAVVTRALARLPLTPSRPRAAAEAVSA
jgi:lysophospholipase L1-like esterase